LGRDGEKIVGQHLETLRQSGCIVFHDIVGNGFNIDHVVVAPGGIFTVETKTYSKPARVNTEIQHDGQRILIGGFETDKDLIGQARAQQNWLRGVLEQRTKKRFSVKATIVFPGWYVKTPTGRAGQYDVWVFNENALAKYIQGRNRVLSDRDIELAVTHLATYIQAAA
jgi:hypothetical protein